MKKFWSKKQKKRLVSYLNKYKKVFAVIGTIALIVIIGSSVKNDLLRAGSPRSSPSPSESPLYEDFHLTIPSLNIDAPIIADVDGADESTYYKALENGVAQLKGSSKPGKGSNVFIFGHSSYYWYKPGDYKKIFANLEDIKIGDQIVIWYVKKKYVYTVSETKVVRPDEVNVIAPTSEEQVSLMTCVPPGTTRYRLIVIGKPQK